MTLTLTDALAKVRSLLDETSAAFWSDTELTRWINEGQNDVARRAECNRTSDTVAVTAGTQDYTAPTELVRIHRVEWQPTGQTQIYPLLYRDYYSADSVWGSMQAQTDGTPVIYTTWGYPPALNIKLFPTPTVNGNIEVFYYSLPTALASGADEMDLPSGWEELAVEYAVAMAKRKDGDPTWQEAFRMYRDELDNMREMVLRFTDQPGQIDDVGGMFAPFWLYEMGDVW